MSKENQQWGASRIHGELLMLGFEVAQSTVSKYMVRGGTPPSQSWKTFLRNHAQAIAAIDLFVVPTLTFERLFAFLVLGHGRRQLLWFEVTRHPTAGIAGTTDPHRIGARLRHERCLDGRRALTSGVDLDCFRAARGILVAKLRNLACVLPRRNGWRSPAGQQRISATG
jgi:hypothetical protein